jgi:anti-sigma factor RsiW
MTDTNSRYEDDDFHAYVDGVLDNEARANVEQYLATDPKTAARVSAWQADTVALRRALTAKVEEPIPYALLSHRLRPTRRDDGWRRYAIAASITAAFVSGTGAGWLGRGSPEAHGLASLGQQAAVAQQVFAYAPQALAQMNGQPALRVGLDASNPGRAIAAPDLRAAGYTLLGGRLVPTRQGSAALFVYRRKDNLRIGVMVRRMIGIDTDAAMRQVPVEGAIGYAWSRRGIGFSVVSRQPQADLHAVADHLQTLT